MPTHPPGSRLDDYELIRHAATGAMSEVYEGRHVTTGLRVAVKVLHPELCDQRELVTRFLNEGSTLQHLRHARIVTIFALGNPPKGPPYMVLEWLPVDLHEVLARAAAPLPLHIALRIARQLGEALTALHEHGLVHRDLKPANVLVAREGPEGWEVKLADLGLAKMFPGDAGHGAGEEARWPSSLPISTGRSTILGTWDYMAPEQWVQSKNVDPKADVYGLGVLLFQLLTGRLPFIAEQAKDLMYFHLLEPPPLERLGAHVSTPTRGLIARMLDKKPSQRPSMHEVLVQLAEPTEP
jgi:serine/threonine protein kinase